MGHKAARVEVISALVATLEDRDQSEQLRLSVCRALGEMGDKTATPEVISALVATLEDQNQSEQLKWSVCRALGKMGRKSATDNVIPKLQIALLKGSASVKESVCNALGQMGEKAASVEVINALMATLEDQNQSEQLKLSVCRALGKMGEKAARDDVVSALAAILEDQSERFNRDDLSDRSMSCHMREVVDHDVRGALWRIIKRTPINKVMSFLLTIIKTQNVQFQKRGEVEMEMHSQMIIIVCKALGKMDERLAINEVIKELLDLIPRFECEPYPEMDDWVEMSGRILERICKALGNISEKSAIDKAIRDLMDLTLKREDLLYPKRNCKSRCKDECETNKQFATPRFMVNDVFCILEEIDETGATFDVISQLKLGAIKILAHSQYWPYYLDTIPAEKLIETFFKTGYQIWLPALTRVIFRERNAVTITKEHIVVYGNNEPVSIPVTNSAYRQQLVKAFDQRWNRSGFFLTGTGQNYWTGPDGPLDRYKKFFSFVLDKCEVI
jgi:hypothetical protein